MRTSFIFRILRLLSSRWLEKLKDKWWPRPQYDVGGAHCANHPDHFDGIGLDNIVGFILIMLAGIGVASLALVGEWLFYRRQPSRLQPETEAAEDSVHVRIWRAGQVASSVAQAPGARRRSVGWAESVADGNANGGHEVAKALADIVKCRQHRRRMSHSLSAEDPDAICCISSVEV